MTPPIRVLIVEDSAVVLEFLRHIIDADPRLEVVAAVGSAEEALRILDRVSPDVISMDIRLPGMNGFEATRRIMAERPTPIVVVSASVESDDLQITMNALRAGALTVLEKPAGTLHSDYAALAHQICTQLVIMSEVKVVSQRHYRAAAVPAPAFPGPSRRYEMLGIASSTGGPHALTTLLPCLGKGFPLPILLVQHITSSFLEGFVAWLNEASPLPVHILENGQIPDAGHVYVAPPEHHLLLRGRRLWADRQIPVSLQRPSCTVLFQSMARELGPAALGIILTGMGNDGAEGLLALRRAGGYSIAEDASTAVVDGMPAAARELGAVCESLPLPDIAPRILRLVS